MARQSENKPPNRRDVLRRLAGAVVAAYVVPEVFMLSAARAESAAPSASSAPSGASTPSPPSDPSAPEPSRSSSPSTGEDRYDDSHDEAHDRCHISGDNDANTISISRSDLARSQRAIAAGHAKPLDQIWPQFISNYDGRVVGVEFIGPLNNPRYRFRAISKAGRLETVTISAQTGIIERIVGC